MFPPKKTKARKEAFWSRTFEQLFTRATFMVFSFLILNLQKKKKKILKKKKPKKQPSQVSKVESEI